jgi:hypothetical protein
VGLTCSISRSCAIARRVGRGVAGIVSVARVASASSPTLAIGISRESAGRRREVFC